MPMQYYEDNALQLAKVYQSYRFEMLHASWLKFVTPLMSETGLKFLDIGAGAGRDARFFAEQAENAEVVAVEPVCSLNRLGQAYTRDMPVNWYQDELPCLYKVRKNHAAFDVILVSSVFNYLQSSSGQQAMLTLRTLLNQHGLLAIKLRHCDDEEALKVRGMQNCSVEYILDIAQKADLHCLEVTEPEEDAQGRASVTWQTLLFKPAQ
ncbi:class I SAM-dependent methyltransferase [Pseudoalteromonas rubra]|uniref:Class I SAM-dependent methyltransferase n=1 Tax=Pseudoalteromonas rubra TaxID=43658 RepID=A0A5S3WUW7_9GAMM|nr:class I SAM-dependent methyltransferase [Pseudoalteromonas rubra]TMP32628.1 class I SAM-dependent methyltransferase [Pseudoalteromonas rubra]TMP34308.1 class I SAM-dependent methyltransferase [Pseudoalteromonas rubra]